MLIARRAESIVLDPKRANPAFEVLEPRFYSKKGQRYGLKVP
jgi:hypothetical protein